MTRPTQEGATAPVKLKVPPWLKASAKASYWTEARIEGWLLKELDRFSPPAGGGVLVADISALAVDLMKSKSVNDRVRLRDAILSRMRALHLIPSSMSRATLRESEEPKVESKSDDGGLKDWELAKLRRAERAKSLRSK